MTFKREPSLQWAPRHTGWMKSNWRFCVSIALAAGLLFGAAAGPNSVQAAGSNWLSVFEKRPLKFGTVTSSIDGPGTAKVSTSGVLTTTGYTTYLKGRVRAAKFQVFGPKNATVLITLPTSVTFSSWSGTTTLSNFTSSPPAGLATLNKRGKLTIDVGATMAVPAGQSAGGYWGTFPIYVDQQ